MRHQLTALLERRADGTIELRSPTVGLLREVPPHGTVVRPGTRIGAIEVLGRVYDLVAPEGAFGATSRAESRTSPPGASGATSRAESRTSPQAATGARARIPVGYGDTLMLLDTQSTGQLAAPESPAPEHRSSGVLFEAPMSGRFYRRPAPDKPPFVEEGDEVGDGQTICLLEVMKTFNRITYGGAGHPVRARVVRVIPADGADLAAGDPILELQPI